MSKQNNKHESDQKNFYGTVTVGEKGQIVIPHGARKNLKLKKSDKLLVFGMHEDMLALVKLSQIGKITSHLSETLDIIRNVSKK